MESRHLRIELCQVSLPYQVWYTIRDLIGYGSNHDMLNQFIAGDLNTDHDDQGNATIQHKLVLSITRDFACDFLEFCKTEQPKILERAFEQYYESDGHYEGKRADVREKYMATMMLSDDQINDAIRAIKGADSCAIGSWMRKGFLK